MKELSRGQAEKEERGGKEGMMGRRLHKENEGSERNTEKMEKRK